MDFKENLIEKIKTTASTIPDLESLTIVGSHGNLEKALEKTNDFDLMFLFKKLDVKSYLSIKNVMDHLAAELNSLSTKVWTEYRVGPVKATYDTKEDMGVMLHILLFDVQTFGDYKKVSPFIALDWLKFKALYGKNLTDIYNFSFPTKEELLHAPRASFEYYDKMLNDKVYLLLDIEIDGDNLKYNRNTYPYPKAQWGELYADLLKKVILNTVIVYSQMNKSWEDEELVNKFCEIFPNLNTSKKEIEEIIKLKKRMRAGEDFSADIEKYEITLRKLLSQIKAEVEK